MTIISFVSDLHLEFQDCILPGGDILLVGGDTLISGHLRECATDGEALRWKPVYERFIAEEFRKYWRVFVIMGNHDFWQMRLDTAVPLVRAFLAKHAPNATLLDDEWVETDGVRIIGSTLWATYGIGTAYHVLIQEELKDFVRIKVYDTVALRERKLVVGDLAERHEQCMDFLRKAVKTEKPCIIMTHHSPTYLAANRKRFPDCRFDDAYCANQHEFILDNSQIKLWVHGHSHYRYRATIGETRIVSNSRGYYGYDDGATALGFDATEADFDVATMDFA